MPALETLEARTLPDAGLVPLVRGLYRNYLDRTPSGVELAAWVRRLEDGAAREQVRGAFLASAEYVAGHGADASAWLTAVYQDVLGRQPDGEGLEQWKRLLDVGAPRWAVALGILESPEGRNWEQDGEAGVTDTRISIDQKWLDERGDGPYLLTVANATYVLDVDVTTPETAFVAAAGGVTFDLNGHTITYGDRPAVVTSNGGFEEECAKEEVPGWTFSGPAAVSCRPVRVGMWGKQMLHLDGLREGDLTTLVSSPVELPRTGREYTATITPFGSCWFDSGSARGLKVVLKVLDADTGDALATAPPPNGSNRGFAALVSFVPASDTNRVQLQVEITYSVPTNSGCPAGGWVDLDEAAVMLSRDYGVLASWDNSWFPLHLRPLPGWNRASNFTVQNTQPESGGVLQGQGLAWQGSPLMLRDVSGVTVQNVWSRARGMDTNNFDGFDSRDITLRDSVFEADIDHISNRTNSYAVVKLQGSRGTVLVEGNRILHSPAFGIALMESRNDFISARIAENWITQRTIAADGYGILVVHTHDFEIADNLIEAINGRGMLFDGYGSRVTRTGRVHQNVAYAREVPLLEYPDFRELDATALRIRALENSQIRDVRFWNNIFIADTQPGSALGAVGARVTHVGWGGVMNGANNLLEDNLFQATVLTDDSQYYATALSLSWIAPGTGLQFWRNQLKSNDVALQVGDNESYQSNQPTQDVTLVLTRFEKVVDGFNRYRAVVVGWHDSRNTIGDIRLISSIPELQASDFHFEGRPPDNHVLTGWLVTCLVSRQRQPVEGASCRARDRNGVVRAAEVTDALGNAILPVGTVVRRRSGAEDLNDFQLDVTYAAQEVSQRLRIRGNVIVLVNL